MEFILMITVGVLTVAVALFVLEPILRPGNRRQGTSSAESEYDLHVRKDMLLKDIKELELDYATGKLEESDFDLTMASYRSEASQVMEELDIADDGASVSNLIEARIVASRKARYSASGANQDIDVASTTDSDKKCGQCAEVVDIDAKFCIHCGNELA